MTFEEALRHSLDLLAAVNRAVRGPEKEAAISAYINFNPYIFIGE